MVPRDDTMREMSSSTINRLDPNKFPPLLREIPDPPAQLYTKGTLPPEDTKLLCVVGSRKYSSYGKQTVESLISSLQGKPVAVVSGLALGIDALAHEAALKADLRTIAVPGSGLDRNVLAPRSNLGLADRILLAGGTLLSEFEPEFESTPWAFPQRNRIMAGISHAVLIIEARERSGTLITARLAGEYNRDVLAVPGSIFSDSSVGPHQLIRDGATPITSSDDLHEALGLESEPVRDREIDRSHYSADELALLDRLSEPQTRDDLIRASALGPSKANMTITALEMKGVIKEERGQIRKL
ncbi:MAG: DNA-processing protein DprA [Candidatus Paceibacterota bacterium]